MGDLLFSPGDLGGISESIPVLSLFVFSHIVASLCLCFCSYTGVPSLMLSYSIIATCLAHISFRLSRLCFLGDLNLRFSCCARVFSCMHLVLQKPLDLMQDSTKSLGHTWLRLNSLGRGSSFLPLPSKAKPTSKLRQLHIFYTRHSDWKKRCW